MLGALHTPIAKLQEFNLSFNFFLVLLAPIISALALLADEFDEPFLRHSLVRIAKSAKISTLMIEPLNEWVQARDKFIH